LAQRNPFDRSTAEGFNQYFSKRGSIATISASSIKDRSDQLHCG
jgi:hypothetical protein